MSVRLRMRYRKTDKAAYISHLDFTALMCRAMLRAGVELKYSEGFNPHPYISVALPLQVGCGSDCELLDYEAAEERDLSILPSLLNRKLPEGIEILKVYYPKRKFSDIAWLEIQAKLHFCGESVADIAERLSKHFLSEHIVIMKRTKRGESEIDIKPFIRGIKFTNGREFVSMSVTVSAQQPSITPNDIIKSIGDGLSSNMTFAEFVRTEAYDAEMKVFE